MCGGGDPSGDAEEDYIALVFSCVLCFLAEIRVSKVGAKIREMMFGLVKKADPKKKDMPRRKLCVDANKEPDKQLRSLTASPAPNTEDECQQRSVIPHDSQGNIPSTSNDQAVGASSIPKTTIAKPSPPSAPTSSIDRCVDSRNGDRSMSLQMSKLAKKLRRRTKISSKKKVTLHECSNTTCFERESDGQRFQSCGFCTTRYCSKKCAQESWKSHRLVCPGSGQTSRYRPSEQISPQTDSCQRDSEMGTSDHSYSSKSIRSDRFPEAGSPMGCSTSIVSNSKSSNSHTARAIASRTNNVLGDVTCSTNNNSRSMRRTCGKKPRKMFDCSNPDCSERERIGRKFQKCGLCSARYCSVACSERSWKTHKRVCAGYVARSKKS